MPATKKVAIVGAGPAGLIVANELLQAGVDVTLFEQRDCLGGTWALQPLKKTPDLREGLDNIHSAAYSSLRCNFPQQMMTFSTQSTSLNEEVTYLYRKELLNNLQTFSDRHQLTPLIKFNEQVIQLTETHTQKKKHWQLKTTSGSESLFDGVVFCNGRYGAPQLPDLNKLMSFTGRLEHSLTYRNPEDYKNKRVAILGSGPSAEDISRELSAYASEVFVCTHPNSRKHIQPEPGLYGVRKNILRCGDIKKAEGKTLLISDGSQLDNIDVLMLCTGYQVDSHLLSALPESRIATNGLSIAPLYLNLFHPKHPELTVVGMDLGTIPFILYQYQAKIISQFWLNKLPLPSIEQRIFAAEQQDLRESVKISFAERLRKAKHRFRQLATMAQVPPLDDGYFDLLDQNNQHRWEHPDNYREISWLPK